jgi:hypothetical protein
MTASSHKTATTVATASEIRAIVGPLEDGVVAKLLDIGPSSEEVLAAYTWLRADNRLEHRPEFELHGKSAQALAILEQEEPDPGDDLA